MGWISDRSKPSLPSMNIITLCSWKQRWVSYPALPYRSLRQQTVSVSVKSPMPG